MIRSARFRLFLLAAVLVSSAPSLRGQTLFSENFDGLTLGSSIDEGTNEPGGVAADGVWTNTLPEGWSVENDMPGLDDPTIGVTEWEGWSFADREWWAQTAGDQDRTQFVLGTGVVAIADPDEWDDFGSPGGLGTFNSFLSTPEIAIAGAAPGSIVLNFDSSWRDEDTQAANIQVSFDGGEPIEVLRFSSDPNDPNFKDDAPNESLSVSIDNPAGAATMVITFGVFDATNDWWWAIDNVEVTAAGAEPVPALSGPGLVALVLALFACGALAIGRRRPAWSRG